MRTRYIFPGLTLLFAVGVACGSNSDSGFNGGGDNPDGGGGPGSGDDSGGGGGFHGDDGGGSKDSGATCETQLVLTFHDFKPCYAVEQTDYSNLSKACQANSNPDFEHYQASESTPNIVIDTLTAPDFLPVYNESGGPGGGPPVSNVMCGPNNNQSPCPEVTSTASFNQWYRNVPGTNKVITHTYQFDTTSTPGHLIFDRSDPLQFFPLDNDPDSETMGHGPTPGNDTICDHNFSFTTEAHIKFTYQPGQTFKFTGDDDLWVFINNKLAIDLGGLHPQKDKSADFASLNLTPGQTYPMDLFHAERHTQYSHFRIETTIGCFTNVPPPIH